MTLRMTPEQVTRHRQRIGADDYRPEAGKPAERAVEPVRGPRYRSSWEANFAGKLELMRRAGEIVDYGHERIKFRLPGDRFYCPDFDALTPSGETLVFEVKGYARRLAMDRLRAAVEIYPGFRWHIVRKDMQPHRLLTPADVPSR